MFSVDSSVVKAYTARMSLPRFSTVMPSFVTSVGSCGSARLMAFCRFTMAMSVSVPLLNVTVQE